MPIGQYTALRNTAVFALAVLAAMLLAAILFESGQSPIAYVLQAWVPLLSVAAIPLGCFIVWITLRPSRGAIALGVAYPVAVLFLFWRAVNRELDGNTEDQMNIVLMFMFFWFNVPWMLFLIGFVPAMARMLVLGWRALAALPRRPVGAAIAWTLALLVIGSTGFRSTVRAARDVPQWQPWTVDNTIDRLNECIWRYKWATGAQAFPESLAEIGRVPYRVYKRTAGSQSHLGCEDAVRGIPTKPFDVEYRITSRDETGRADGFQITVVEKVRPGGRPHVVWYDEKNVRMEAVRTGGDQLDSVRVLAGTALGQFLIVQHWIDGYTQTHGGAPPSIIVNTYALKPEERDPPPAGVLAARWIGNFDHAGHVPAGASRFGRNDFSFIYEPVRDAAGRVTSYRLTLVNPTYYDDVERQVIPARTYHRDVTGQIHAYGGMRPANETDPPVLEEELRVARDQLQIHLEERMRDSVAASARAR